MKILHICTDKNIGGAGQWIKNLLDNLDPEKIQSTVLLPKGSALSKRLEAGGVKVVELDIKEKSFDIKAIFTLRREIRRQQPDIVHTHGSFSGRLAGKLAGKKVVITRHWAKLPGETGKPPGKISRLANNYFSDKWIATAKQAEGNLLEIGVPAKKIVCIENGVSPLEKKPEDWIRKKKESLGITACSFGILARLEEVKGHKYILEALKILMEENKDLELTLSIAGRGDLEEALKTQALACELGDRVKFLGFYEKPAEFLSLLDVQINASYTETTCLALLEGFSIGVPAIASTGGGNPDVVKTGENGLLFSVGNPRELAACMKIFMEDKQLRETLSEGAKTCFKKKYTAQRFAQEVVKVYEEVTQ